MFIYFVWQYSTCFWTENVQLTKFIGPTWGPPGSCRPQMGPMLASWTLLSGWSCSDWPAVHFYADLCLFGMLRLAVGLTHRHVPRWRVHALWGVELTFAETADTIPIHVSVTDTNRVWISNYIHVKLLLVKTHPFPYCNDGLFKVPWK